MKPLVYLGLVALLLNSSISFAGRECTYSICADVERQSTGEFKVSSIYHGTSPFFRIGAKKKFAKKVCEELVEAKLISFTTLKTKFLITNLKHGSGAMAASPQLDALDTVYCD